MAEKPIGNEESPAIKLFILGLLLCGLAIWRGIYVAGAYEPIPPMAIISLAVLGFCLFWLVKKFKSGVKKTFYEDRIVSRSLDGKTNETLYYKDIISWFVNGEMGEIKDYRNIYYKSLYSVEYQEIDADLSRNFDEILEKFYEYSAPDTSAKANFLEEREAEPTFIWFSIPFFLISAGCACFYFSHIISSKDVITLKGTVKDNILYEVRSKGPNSTFIKLANYPGMSFQADGARQIFSNETHPGDTVEMDVLKTDKADYIDNHKQVSYLSRLFMIEGDYIMTYGLRKNSVSYLESANHNNNIKVNMIAGGAIFAGFGLLFLGLGLKSYVEFNKGRQYVN